MNLSCTNVINMICYFTVILQHAYGNYCQIKLSKNNFLTNPDIRAPIQFFQILKRNSGLPGGFVGVVAIRVFAGGATGVLVAVLT